MRLGYVTALQAYTDKCWDLLYRHFILQFLWFAAGQLAMYEADAQSVLRCGRCNKPFDKGELYLHQILLRNAVHVLIVP
jgi:hypothetical protein